MQWMRRHARGRPPYPDVLTPAEWRVLEQIRAGHSNAEIAVRSGLSINTVKTHVTSIHAKTGIAERSGLVAWDGAPAARGSGAEARAGRGHSNARLGGPFALTSMAGAKVAGAALVAVLFVGALYLVFTQLDVGDGEGAAPSSSAMEERAASFPSVPCGVDLFAFRRFEGDTETWDCFRDALTRGERVQAWSFVFEPAGPWGTGHGDGTGMLLTSMPAGGLEVMEVAFTDWIPGAQRHYVCAELVAVEPEALPVLDGCGTPAVVDQPQIAEGTVRFCGAEVWAFGAQPAAWDERARQCILDAIEAGEQAQLFFNMYTDEGGQIRHVMTTTASGPVDLYTDSKDGFGAMGRFVSRCHALEPAAPPHLFSPWSEECTQARRVEGPAEVCGVDVVVAGAVSEAGQSWHCFRTNWERGEHSLLFEVQVTAEGTGIARSYVSGRGSLAEEGFAFNYSAAEIELDGFVAKPGRTYYGGCGIDDGATRGIDDCHRRRYRVAEVDIYSEPHTVGGALWCGVEVIERSASHVNEDARRCLLDAFEEGSAAQLLSVWLSGWGHVRAEVVTVFGPEIVEVRRDRWEPSGRHVVRDLTCASLDTADAPDVFAVVECEVRR